MPPPIKLLQTMGDITFFSNSNPGQYFHRINNYIRLIDQSSSNHTLLHCVYINIYYIIRSVVKGLCCCGGRELYIYRIKYVALHTEKFFCFFCRCLMIWVFSVFIQPLFILFILSVCNTFEKKNVEISIYIFYIIINNYQHFAWHECY